MDFFNPPASAPSSLKVRLPLLSRTPKNIPHPSIPTAPKEGGKREKRQRVEMEMMTPPPSSSPSANDYPAKSRPASTSRFSLLTPTSSSPTVHLPSSPLPPSSPPSAFPSSPSHPTHSHPSQQPQNIPYPPSTILILGRSRHTPPQPSSLPLLPLPTLTPSLPHAFRPLPREARHASRYHLAVELLQGRGEVRVVVLGQNGVRMGWLGDKAGGKRYSEGRTVVLPLPTTLEGSCALEVDFYSCKTIINFSTPPTSSSTGTTIRTPTNHLQTPIKRHTSSLSLTLPLPTYHPTTQLTLGSGASSPLSVLDSPVPEKYAGRGGLEKALVEVAKKVDEGRKEEEDEMMEEKEGLEKEQNPTSEYQPSGGSSPLSPTPFSLPLLPPSLPSTPSLPHPTPTSTSRPSSSHKRKPSQPPREIKQEEENLPMPALPEGVDFDALIATTLVFSGSSAVGLGDLVRNVLESQPSMRELGNEQTWTGWIQRALAGKEMFGVIERKGKDVSGKHLLPLYYYLPLSDPDTTRAAELGGLVRPLRGAQRKGGKAIDWRPVGGGRRKREGEGD